MIIQDLQKRTDLVFVENNQDINFIKDYLGEKASEFDTFFVKIDEGDYIEVYGVFGNVPYLEKEIYRII